MPKKMGRPTIKIDEAHLEGLCEIQCTLREIATALRCSEDTIERWCKKEKQLTFAEYFKQKASKGHASLRRKQFDAAMSGNVTMLVWLGKNWLNQKDKHDVELSGKDGDAIQIHTSQESKNLTDAELKDRLRQILQPTQEPS